MLLLLLFVGTYTWYDATLPSKNRWRTDWILQLGHDFPGSQSGNGKCGLVWWSLPRGGIGLFQGMDNQVWFVAAVAVPSPPTTTNENNNKIQLQPLRKLLPVGKTDSMQPSCVPKSKIHSTHHSGIGQERVPESFIASTPPLELLW